MCVPLVDTLLPQHPTPDKPAAATQTPRVGCQQPSLPLHFGPTLEERVKLSWKVESLVVLCPLCHTPSMRRQSLSLRSLSLALFFIGAAEGAITDEVQQYASGSCLDGSFSLNFSACAAYASAVNTTGSDAGLVTMTNSTVGSRSATCARANAAVYWSSANASAPDICNEPSVDCVCYTMPTPMPTPVPTPVPTPLTGNMGSSLSPGAWALLACASAAAQVVASSAL